jgi:hypothetical protein
MKLEHSKEWWMKMAEREGDHEIGAGFETCGIPRRARMDQWHPAERAIWEVAQAIEGMGAHPRLTEAIALLGMARDAVADFIEDDEKTQGKHQ